MTASPISTCLPFSLSMVQSPLAPFGKMDTPLPANPDRVAPPSFQFYFALTDVPPSPARPPFLTRCFEQRVVVDGKIVSQLCDENGTLHLAQFQQAMRKQVRRRIAPRCCCSPVPFFGASPLMRFWWL